MNGLKKVKIGIVVVGSATWLIAMAIAILAVAGV